MGLFNFNKKEEQINNANNSTITSNSSEQEKSIKEKFFILMDTAISKGYVTIDDIIDRYNIQTKIDELNKEINELTTPNNINSQKYNGDNDISNDNWLKENENAEDHVNSLDEKESLLESTYTEEEVKESDDNNLNNSEESLEEMFGLEDTTNDYDAREIQPKEQVDSQEIEDFIKGELDYHEIKVIIEDLFNEINFDTVCLRKLIGRLYALEEPLMEKYGLKETNIGKFIREHFNYYVNDFYISKIPIRNIGQMISSKFNGKALITKEDISDFFNQIGYDNHKPYNTYFGYLTYFGYVQISEDAIIKTDSLYLDDDSRATVEKVLNFSLDNTRKINITSDKRLYLLLPNIQYEWNEYLLINIIKKYYSDKYIIEKSGNEYYIRKKEV